MASALTTTRSIMYLNFSFGSFWLLSLPLASALSVPQKILAEDPEHTLSDPAQHLAIEDAEFNITAHTSMEDWNPTTWDYDAIIVGGGPGGLAASMSLARVARTSLLYDTEEYRNGQTRYMHDVLGQDGNIMSLYVRAVGVLLTASRRGTTEVSSRSTPANR